MWMVTLCSMRIISDPTYCLPLESTKTTSMEDVSTGVFENMNNIQEVKIKPKIWCINPYIIAYAKMQINEDILSNMSNLQRNWCLKIDFQNVDQHAGGKSLIHDTKRRKDTQLQSLGSDGTLLNPIFWKKVQGQKLPGRWGIV